jgi:dienelactone hydrolase
MAGTDAKPLLFAIDWAIKENERPCSKYYHKLDVTKIAVSGQSCGGLMAIDAAVDPRITTAFPYDSGLFSRDQTIYDALHAPMAIFDGGDQDIAYANGLADFNAITKIPMLFANPKMCSSNAHVCTFFDKNAGEFGRAGVAWMNWHLLGDQGATGKGMFVGDNCGLCDTTKWDLMWKMKPQ